MILSDIFNKRAEFQPIYKKRVKILNTKFEILNNIKSPKFKTKKLEARGWNGRNNLVCRGEAKISV